MANSSSAPQNQLKVFLSYSRRDSADFAEELVAGLELAGFDPFLDRQDVAPGEDWQQRLGRLIESADVVVFIISPASIESERCAWEVDHTHKLRKRVLPIVWRAVEESRVPAVLRQLNYIFFDQAHAFGPSLRTLAAALRTDINWVREHTRIGEAALRWDARGRAEALLLRGEELAAAKGWLNTHPTYAQEPTLLQHEFIKASEGADVARVSAERQRLQEMERFQNEREKALDREKSALLKTQAAVRNMQRAQVVIALLLAGVIVGIIGWFNQAYLRDQVQWYTVLRPYVKTMIEPHILTVDTEKKLPPRATFKECAQECPEMVVIPTGNAMMGSQEGHGTPSERPIHEIRIDRPFAVSKHEVTHGEWEQCVKLRGCAAVSKLGIVSDKQPVNNVSWDDAQQYVAWLARLTGKPYRLLSEAEWEYSARAGSSTNYSFGDALLEICAHGNVADVTAKKAYPHWNAVECDDGHTYIAPVGTYRPNAFGLHDMYGNVWEWVEDGWHDDYVGAPGDGSAWPSSDRSFRILRGGSWYNYPELARSSYRYKVLSVIRDVSFGFRVARTLARQ